MCMYNSVNMSNRVSIVKTDYFDCMSLANIWMERGVVAGSHIIVQKFSYIYREHIKKIETK